MPIFSLGGLACTGKTTLVRRQALPAALTDFTQQATLWPVFRKKTGDPVIASTYNSLIASIHAKLNLQPETIIVDRFHWEGTIFEAIFSAKTSEELTAKLDEIIPVLRAVHENDQYDGALLIDSDETAHLNFLNDRGDHLEREFELEYIQRQNLAFTMVGNALGIPVVDVSRPELTSVVPKPVGDLLAGGVLDILQKYRD